MTPYNNGHFFNHAAGDGYQPNSILFLSISAFIWRLICLFILKWLWYTTLWFFYHKSKQISINKKKILPNVLLLVFVIINFWLNFGEWKVVNSINYDKTYAYLEINNSIIDFYGPELLKQCLFKQAMVSLF